MYLSMKNPNSLIGQRIIGVYFGHEKALGKGGHHLGLFHPTTHRRSTPEDRKRDPPHTNTGPAGYRDCYAFEVTLKVEVILIADDLRRNHQP